MLKYIVSLTVIVCFTSVGNAEEGESFWSKSYALEANGEYEKAAALLVPYMDNGGESEFALMRYGWLNYLQGNFNDSIKVYKQALERNQRSFDARLGITLPLMAQQRWNEARRFLKQVLAQSPYNYVAHIRLMACEEGLRKWEVLEEHARGLSAHYPADASVLVYMARAYAWQGKNQLAKQMYKRVLTRIPAHVEALRYLNK